MVEVIAPGPEALPRDDRRRERSSDERKDRSSEDRRRDRDSRERRDDRAGPREERDDRPPRRGGEHHEKRAGHEERGGAGSGSDRRERDREHKRRKTPSPPPPHSHRDRRHSPLRRSPPPYKRTRRDDDLVGDFAFSGDRRHGYDGFNQHDRPGLMGGRGAGFGGDDRMRYSNSRGWPGSGRSGFTDGPHAYGGMPARREGLMTYKQFIAELEDDILPAEAERRYEEYKAEYTTTQKRNFFAQHKDEEWLREKYDPSRLESVLLRRNENVKALAKDFQAELEAGTLDVGPSAVGNWPGGEGGSEEDGDVSGKRRRPGHAVSKEKELDAAPKVPAVSGEPKRITKDVDQARALIKKLDVEKGVEGNILTQENQSIEGDRSLSGTAVGHIVIVRGGNQVKGYEGVELLDVMLTYLWRVHGLDYYGGIEFKEAAKGYRHVRKDAKVAEEPGSVSAADWEKRIDTTWQARLQGRDPIEAMLGREKLETAANEALDPYVRKIKDEKYGWKYGCGAKGCTKLFHGPEYVHKHLKLKHPELVSDVITKSRQELYFQNYMSDRDAPGVTHNTSHQPSQREKGRRRRGGGGSGAPERLSGDRIQMMAQPSLGGGRSIRDSDRFERTAGRDNERFDRGGLEEERFDRGNEQSPTRGEFAPPTMGVPNHDAMGGPPGTFDAGSNDTPMFDAFPGPPMRGPPAYGSDMPPPPPVLMPVPGAGPLGPFVPAPPEVAMRMLREQGGPPPFHPSPFEPPFDGEANGGGHGRRGRSHHPGSHMSGSLMDNPPMMIPMSQALRPDPRHVRSYHDLDAPEDEVTVIDYRSL